MSEEAVIIEENQPLVKKRSKSEDKVPTEEMSAEAVKAELDTLRGVVAELTEAIAKKGQETPTYQEWFDQMPEQFKSFMGGLITELQNRSVGAKEPQQKKAKPNPALMVATGGSVIRDPSFTSADVSPPEGISDKGPEAVARWRESWEAGSGYSSAQASSREAQASMSGVNLDQLVLEAEKTTPVTGGFQVEDFLPRG